MHEERRGPGKGRIKIGRKKRRSRCNIHDIQPAALEKYVALGADCSHRSSMESGRSAVLFDAVHVDHDILLGDDAEEAPASRNEKKTNDVASDSDDKTTKRTHPLWMTRTCRRPSLRNMSMTVSMGVWSVTVMGARSRMRRSFTGARGDTPTGRPDVKTTGESSLMSSCLRRAFPALPSRVPVESRERERERVDVPKFRSPSARRRSRRRTEPTSEYDSLDTTTGKALCSVSSSTSCTSLTVIESCVSTVSGALPLPTTATQKPFQKTHQHRR